MTPRRAAAPVQEPIQEPAQEPAVPPEPTPTPPGLTEEQIERARRLYAQGLSVQDLAQAFGVDEALVVGALQPRDGEVAVHIVEDVGDWQVIGEEALQRRRVSPNAHTRERAEAEIARRVASRVHIADEVAGHSDASS